MKFYNVGDAKTSRVREEERCVHVVSLLEPL